jgi:xylulokinase
LAESDLRTIHPYRGRAACTQEIAAIATNEDCVKGLLLGIDVGTYSSKACLVTVEGRVVGSATVPHGISTPAPGFVEQDADAVWWHDVTALCRQLLSNNAFSAQDIAAVSVSAIGPCLVPLNEHGRALRPAMLYGVDVRAKAEVEELNREIGPTALFEHSLMALSSQAIGPKIRWLRKNAPDVWARTRYLATASSYLMHRLTGLLLIDHHTASHFVPLYDPRTRQWSARHADGLAPIDMLPTLGWSNELAGEITPEAAAETGLLAGTPVGIGAVDALSEAISVGVVDAGDLMVMYGSTTFFILVQDAATPSPTVWTTAGAFQPQFNLAAGMSTTGSLTRWFKDELARDLSADDGYARLFTAAARVEPGAQGLLMLPYFSGERTPISDPDARGVIAGLNLTHTRDHLFRAVLESVGYGIRHNLETFRSIGAQIRRVVAVGGGAQSDIWPQIVSDIVGCEQEVPAVTIGASYGDAFLAGCALGVLNQGDIHDWVKPGRVITPNAAHRSLYDHLYANYLDLYANTRSVVHSIGHQHLLR